jgi:hypothetical protein
MLHQSKTFMTSSRFGNDCVTFEHPQIAEIAAVSAQHLQGRLDPTTLRPVIKPNTEPRVADATSAYYIDGTSPEDDSVLIVSAPAFPDTVEHSVMTAVQARTLLGTDLGSTVCVPVLADRWQGRSFAVYPRLDGFSMNRLVQRVQKHRAAPAIVRWLSATFCQSAVERTGAAELDRRILAPLQNLIDDPDIPEGIRATALAAVKAVQAGRARTVTCLQHGDFWFGNIMFERGTGAGMAPFLKRIRVIDWGSSKLDGHPGIDAARFLLSTFGTGSTSARHFANYCKGSKLTPADVAVGCLCALGQLAVELNEFPKRNFVAMVVGVHDFLDHCHALDDLRRRS